jgi:hypothetical protein
MGEFAPWPPVSLALQDGESLDWGQSANASGWEEPTGSQVYQSVPQEQQWEVRSDAMVTTFDEPTERQGEQ